MTSIQSNLYPWVQEAAKHVGQQEVPGPGFNPWIKNMWLELKGGAWYWNHYKQDDTRLPWCGGFMAYVFKQCGTDYPQKYASAKAWLEWGTRLHEPIFGSICIFGRDGGGHVGIIVGLDKRGRYMILGGNQRDGVNVMPIDPSRFIGAVWPPGYALTFATLPIFGTTMESSKNEA